MNEIYLINSTIDLKLAETKGFIVNGKLSSEYLFLQKKYYLLLERFICNDINLIEIEKKLESSGYYASNKKIIQERLNIKNIILNYFYFRSNLNIEKLNNEQIEILKNSSNKQIVFDMIKTTFKKVILVENFYGLKIQNTKILYDGTSENNLKSNDSLVIGFVNDSKKIKISDEEWDEFIIKTENIKTEIFDSLKEQFMNKLQCKIEFIEY